MIMIFLIGNKMSSLIQCYKDISEDIWYKIEGKDYATDTKTTRTHKNSYHN